MSSDDQEPVTQMKGWLWKGSTGRRLFGRRTWKLRFIISSSERLEYFAAEPFDTPKGFVNWDDVEYIYDSMTSINYPDATDPDSFYFGLRFADRGKEYIMCFRSDRMDDRERWLAHFHAAKAESDRLKEAMKDDDNLLHTTLAKSNGILEKIRLKLRNAVSMKKQRFVKDGIDLDLAYILPNVIAMGYPAEGREAMYRNPMHEVVCFFDKYHKDQYRIYNLCSERSYPPNRFNGNFVRYPFDDHNAAPMELLMAICQDIHQYLSQNTRPELFGRAALKCPLDFLHSGRGNVVSIHCKAGKGRTGLVICCYLMFCGCVRTAEEALQVFGDRRTKDGKGVQIPSQKRYIKYFEQLLFNYHGCIPTSQLIIDSIILSTTPRFDADGGSDPFVIIKKRQSDHKHRCMKQIEGNFTNPMELVFDSLKTTKTTHIINQRNFELFLNCDLGECDDLQINLWDEDTARCEHMCSFWIHSGFLDNSGRTTIAKMMIDDAVKDTAHKEFTEDFSVTLTYTLRPSNRLPIAPTFSIPALLSQRGADDDEAA